MSYQPHMSNINKWVQHFRDVVAGKIPSNQDFYVVDTIKQGSTNQSQPKFELVTDTEQTVAQARARFVRPKLIKAIPRQSTAKAPQKKAVKTKRKKSTSKKKTQESYSCKKEAHLQEKNSQEKYKGLQNKKPEENYSRSQQN